MVEVFKTNVQRKTEVKRVVSFLCKAFPSLKINVDLADCDKVLRVEGDHMEPHRIMIVVQQQGFSCELLD